MFATLFVIYCTFTITSIMVFVLDYKALNKNIDLSTFIEMVAMSLIPIVNIIITIYFLGTMIIDQYKILMAKFGDRVVIEFKK